MQSQFHNYGEHGDPYERDNTDYQTFITENIGYQTLLTARGYMLATGFIATYRPQGAGGNQPAYSELCAIRDAAYGRITQENRNIAYRNTETAWRVLKLAGFVIAGGLSFFIAWPACLLLPALGGIAWQVGFGINDRNQKLASQQMVERETAFVNGFTRYMDSFRDRHSGIDVHKSFDAHVTALGNALSAKLALNSPLARYLASNMPAGGSVVGAAAAINACYSPDLASRLERVWSQQTSAGGSLPPDGLFADRAAREQDTLQPDAQQWQGYRTQDQGYPAQDSKLGDSLADL